MKNTNASMKDVLLLALSTIPGKGPSDIQYLLPAV